MADDQLELNLDFGGPKMVKGEPINPALTLAILAEVFNERGQQDDKWGLQSHPMFTLLDGLTPDQARDAYALAASQMKQVNDENDQPGWDTILGEELTEAYEQVGVDVDKLREELVQSTAVLVCMIEQIDREKEAKDG